MNWRKYYRVFDYFSKNMFIVGIKENANGLLACKNEMKNQITKIAAIYSCLIRTLNKVTECKKKFLYRFYFYTVV